MGMMGGMWAVSGENACGEGCWRAPTGSTAVVSTHGGTPRFTAPA